MRVFPGSPFEEKVFELVREQAILEGYKEIPLKEILEASKGMCTFLNGYAKEHGW